MPFPLALFQNVGGELIVIGIVALLLFGKDAPAMARKVGRWYAGFKRSINDASAEIQREIESAADTTEARKASPQAGSSDAPKSDGPKAPPPAAIPREAPMQPEPPPQAKQDKPPLAG